MAKFVFFVVKVPQFHILKQKAQTPNMFKKMAINTTTVKKKHKIHEKRKKFVKISNVLDIL